MDYLILALATWRLTSLIVNEDGPFEIFYRFRVVCGVSENEYGRYGKNELAKALACFWCASVWIALSVVILSMFFPTVVFMPLALSGAAILLDEIRSQE